MQAGWFDPIRLDRRPLAEVLDDHIPADDNPRWKRERRETSIKRVAKGYDPL